MTIEGTLRRSDLAGGAWELHEDGGTIYELEAPKGAKLEDGQRVRVEGRVDEGAMSIQMRGPRLVAKRIDAG